MLQSYPLPAAYNDQDFHRRIPCRSLNEGECLAPVVFSDEMIKSDDTIIRENLRTWKRFGVSFKIGFMVVKEEDFPYMLSLYYSAINDYFNEHPQFKPGRCAIDVGRILRTFKIKKNVEVTDNGKIII